MKLKSFTEKDVRGKKVLLRVDFNVPRKGGEVSDTTRIEAHEKTIKKLLKAGATVVLTSHLGRPKGKYNEEFSLRDVAPAVEKVLSLSTVFCGDCIGPKVEESLAALKDGEVLLLENLRFHPGEQENNRSFARDLASPFDVFVMDAFSASHRADASTSSVMEFLPSFAGDLLQKEVDMLDVACRNPEPPFVLILGGAKVSDKIGVIENLLDRVNTILIGGGMAFTFLKAEGGGIGKSLCEEERIDFAAEMLSRATSAGVEILLPMDVIAGSSLDAKEGVQTVSARKIPESLMGLDIGPETARIFARKAAEARTILWNGPMGVFENPLFASGTLEVAKGVAECTRKGGTTVVGGGDTASAAKALGFDGDVSHVSTGGGASLEFCEGKDLPGIAPLILKEK
ncbi:MAG: phosphoglycerate kinase [Synergistaceae bacterium]|nr:phosphoglycerate kinase [Synergistaceae bacterium]